MTEAVLANFLTLDRKPAAPWLTALRRQAMDRFQAVGYPTTHLEDWRFTNVAPLARQVFHTSENGLQRGEEFRASFFTRGARLVFVNGRFAQALSSTAGLPAGVHLGSLAAAIADPAESQHVERHLAHHAIYRDADQAFVALNTAFLEDGAYLRVPAGTVIADPIVFYFIAVGDGTAGHTRSLVLAGPGSQFSVVESYLGNGETFTNTVTEMVTAENAIVEHYKLQQESSRAFHMGTLTVDQARHSSVTDHSVALGGHLVRNDLRFTLLGEGAESWLNGLYVTNGDQHVDNHSEIDHTEPHCPSRELYKGILDGRSSAVFSGGIVVRQAAQKTDAKQSNKNLLLSRDAIINSKPQLEIWADDVKCTHGATIGRLDPEMLFYLRSRGIAEADARSVLTYAFANELLARMKSAEVRERLEKAVLAKLEGK